MVLQAVRRIALPLTALAVLAGACGGDSPSSDSGRPETAQEAANLFLSLWKDGNHEAMYDLVSLDAQATVERQAFVDRYQAITEEATITGIDYELGPTPSGRPSKLPFSVTFHTGFFGDIQQDNVIPIAKEPVPEAASPGATPKTHDEWRVQWTPSLFFKELDDRSLVHFFTKLPRRGGIYDRNGKELAVDADLPVVGIVPERLTDREAVIARLSLELALPPDEVRAQVETTLPSYYFIPVKTLPYGTPPEAIQKFRDMVDMGVVVREETRRVYPYGAAAAHVLGYLTEVTEAQLQELAPKGFQPGDKVGAAGLEGEKDGILSGERGGQLATITPEGSVARTIAEKPAQPGKDLHLTIDIEVQKTAEAGLGDRVGSVVVLNPQDNSVLALASFPRFDPNDFIQGLSAEKFNSLINDPRQPFLHRPLLATYPPGSTFKVVTTAAGLERGGYGPGSTFHCSPVWTGLGEAFAKNNWQTVDRGYLTPAEGLMASCNPVFYEIAKTLDQTDPNILPDVAQGFGFGQPTGINGLEEAPGVLPGPEWKKQDRNEDWFTGDAVNMGIGQGFVLATPLQIANMYSAIAGDGVLRKPLLVKSIAEAGGAVSQEFQAEQINPLPASSGTLDTIREGLRLVTQSAGGTSYQVFAGSSVDAAGKSGTAEDRSFGANHVFFVAYANRSAPSIVALVALETGESGSREAGPMVRRILEAYLAGGG